MAPRADAAQPRVVYRDGIVVDQLEAGYVVTPKRTIDLNADVGEATEPADIEVERTLLDLVTSVHVACGGHAGDDASMTEIVDAALERGSASVRIRPIPTVAGSGATRSTSTGASSARR